MAVANKHTTLKVSEVVIDPSIQPRTSGVDSAHIKALEEAIGELPPITVVHWDDSYVLVDGWHRLAALQNQGRTEVTVEVLDVDLGADLHRLAFELNASHGRPLSLEDRRSEAARLLDHAPQTSDREIARQCGLSQPTVAKVRAAMERTAQIERTTNRVGRGGYRYEVASSGSDDEAKRNWNTFKRLLILIYDSLDASWWDEKYVAQMLLDHYEDDVYEDVHDVLQHVSSTFRTLADTFHAMAPRAS